MGDDEALMPAPMAAKRCQIQMSLMSCSLWKAEMFDRFLANADGIALRPLPFQ